MKARAVPRVCHAAYLSHPHSGVASVILPKVRFLGNSAHVSTLLRSSVCAPRSLPEPRSRRSTPSRLISARKCDEKTQRYRRPRCCTKWGRAGKRGSSFRDLPAPHPCVFSVLEAGDYAALVYDPSWNMRPLQS
jgi:hypothetical protein